MALHLMAAWGIRTDRKAVQELDDRTRAEWEAIAERLKEHGLIQKSGARNTKLAKAMLIEAMGEDRCKLTVTGERKNAEGLSHAEVVQAGYVKLDEESCVDSGDVILKDYARFGSLIKLRSTYVSALWGGVDKPIQSRFETLLETGRTSSSSPNLQNLPRDPGVRECFVPRAGNVFVFSDYSLAELCSLAQTCIEVCGYSKLAERLNAGFDPHTDMAAQLLGISYEAALALHKRKDKAFKEIRTLAKAANFGFPGGLGPLSFVAFAKATYGVVITEAQAIDLKAKWTRAWPEMFDYFKWIGRLTDGGSAWIRHPISRRCRGNISFTVCANSFFQGRTADGAKAALWEVCRRQYSVPSSDLYGTHTVAFIHDEIGIEVEEERCHEAAMELEKVMVEEFCRFHPDLVPAIAASPSVSRRWYKEAPQIWQNEKLIPWG
jgi:DNA polymerase-1